MIVIYNRLIPFRGFKAINLFGALFVRKGCKMLDTDINHEAIHTAQMREMLFFGFYIAYLIEWLFLLLKFRKNRIAYYHISFEREAYSNQNNLKYLKSRKLFAQYRDL